MCGIIGIVGNERALEIVLDGLTRLEYRGYDSAGVALVPASDLDGSIALGGGIPLDGSVALDGSIPLPGGIPLDGGTAAARGCAPLWVRKAARGTRSLDALTGELAADPPPAGSTAIGHTRWATHGRPTDVNAHPHLDCTGTIALVHNGIIENHYELAAELTAAGHRLASETDTEVLAHLIEAERTARPSAGLLPAVRAALGRVRGAFALAVVSADEPDLLVAARRVSPLVVGVNASDALVASDIPALLGHTRTFFALEDDQIAEVRAGSLRVTGPGGAEVTPTSLAVEWDLEAAQRGGYPDFMSKEIHEQPQAVADTLRDRLLPDGTLTLDEMRISDDELRTVEKVFIVACGSSYHAGLMAKYSIEHWVRLPVEIDIASEFRYRDPVLDSRTLVIGVSQSGETVDTLQALREARRWHAKVLVISNVVDSSMAREADAVLYTRAGPEIGVAATKTHVAQITALQVLALYLAQVRGTLYPTEARDLLDAMAALPGHVATVLEREAEVDAVARSCRDSPSFIFLGRHVGYPVALEGALKLKELSYLRAEGFPAGELKHGPIALVEPGTVVIGVATRTRLWEKMMANVAEVRSRGATIVLVANDGDQETAAQADAVLWVPATNPLFAPIVDVVPLQLFAYALARLHGHDVDRPRNLAKVVTVE